MAAPFANSTSTRNGESWFWQERDLRCAAFAPPRRQKMKKVTGTGGFIFRTKYQAALRSWYHTHLGIDPTPKDCESPSWRFGGGAMTGMEETR